MNVNVVLFQARGHMTENGNFSCSTQLLLLGFTFFPLTRQVIGQEEYEYDDSLIESASSTYIGKGRLWMFAVSTRNQTIKCPEL